MKSLAVHQRNTHKIVIWPNNSSPGYTTKGTETTDLYKELLYTNVHSGVIHASHKVEPAHLSMRWWMDTGNVLKPHNGIVCSNEMSIPTCTWPCQLTQMPHKPWKHAKWAKPVTKDHKGLISFHFYELSRIGKSIDTESAEVAGQKRRRMGSGYSWIGDLFWGDNVLQ